MWAQVLTKKVEDFVDEERRLERIDEELKGPHDVAVFFHVDVLPSDLLSYAKDFFDDPNEQGEPFTPGAEDNGMDFVDENNEEGTGPCKMGERRRRMNLHWMVWF